MRIFFVNFWERADWEVLSGKCSKVFIFIALGIPDHAGTTNPLRQGFGMVNGRVCLESNACEQFYLPVTVLQHYTVDPYRGQVYVRRIRVAHR